MTRKRLFLLAAPLVLAGGAIVGTAHGSLAYNGVGCSASNVGAPATISSGAHQLLTFSFVDSHGDAISGEAITFTETGAAGTVAPTATTTNASGNATTTFTAGANNGSATITATDASPAGGRGSSCSDSVTIQITGSVQGISTGSGSGGAGTTLPDTSTGAPGANGVLYLGIGLALMVLLGGAVTLRRSRATAS